MKILQKFIDLFVVSPNQREEIILLKREIESLREIIRQPSTLSPEAMSLLHDMHRDIWCEANYDPTNESTQKFAAKLAPLIQRLNELIGFRK